jgi:hypothetical protein
LRQLSSYGLMMSAPRSMPNAQSRVPGCLSLPGTSLKTCTAWMSLPAARQSPTQFSSTLRGYMF